MEARRYTPHYTIADHAQWEGDWELWHGTAVAMSPSPTFRHQAVLFALARLLGNQLKEDQDCHCLVLGEHDWRIADDTVVRPDVMIVCGDFDGDFLNRPPSLAAEVLSPATEHKDRTAKAELYAEQGVGLYLLVDPDDGRVESLALRDGRYVPLADASLSTPLHEGCAITLPREVKA